MDINNAINLVGIGEHLSADELARVRKAQRQWNFYEGYHWEEIPDTEDRPQTTENYCATYVNKFVAFELGKGFTINSSNKDLSNTLITEGGLTTVDYLDRVWQDNKRDLTLLEIGQAKSVNGDVWVHVRYEPPEELNDVFEEYTKGRIRIVPLHKGLIFPTYDAKDKDKLIELKIMYQIELVSKQFLGGEKKELLIYKQIWTNDTIEEYHGLTRISNMENPYKLIPFVQIKNYPLVGRNDGVGDIDNLIPINTEYNLKKSDISEIIEYHASPVTIVYGAQIGNLEKGANKVWGGMPKDGKVENLELLSDLGASNKYIDNLKVAMNEIGGVPVGALGGEQAISNTSGVALQFVNAPILDRTRIKRASTMEGLKLINKYILYLSVIHNILEIPENVSKSEFYNTSVEIPDTMPKDALIELQQIEIEMRLGLEHRKGAMKRLGREDIDVYIQDVDKDREEHPDIYGIQSPEDGGDDTAPKDEKLGYNKEGKPAKINSGMTNGET